MLFLLLSFGSSQQTANQNISKLHFSNSNVCVCVSRFIITVVDDDDDHHHHYNAAAALCVGHGKFPFAEEEDHTAWIIRCAEPLMSRFQIACNSNGPSCSRHNTTLEEEQEAGVKFDRCHFEYKLEILAGRRGGGGGGVVVFA